VFLIELTAGVLLTLGVATRIGAAIGTVQATVITLLVVEAPHEWLWTYVMLIVLNVLPLVVTSDARLSLSRRRW
jgi:thiosulfate dehydrogenase [quinone] large subunit